MAVFAGVFTKFKNIKKPFLIIYPLIIIISIPLLLILNTFWNLRTFNRDVNFLIRHQAVSTADTLTPSISKNIGNPEELTALLLNTLKANSEIVNITVFSDRNDELNVVSSTENSENYEDLKKSGLNYLAIGFNQPFAGLNYDPNLRKNIWNVSIPLEGMEGEGKYLLFIKIKTDTVEEILGRTSRDSYVVLAVLTLVTLVLLINHFIFYKKAERASQLEEIDRLKDEFISMAAHELRAPVTALVGYLEMLASEISPEEKEKIKEDLEILNSLISDLNNLIEELLDVSRIEQGRLKIEVNEINVNEIIENVIKLMIPTATQKGLSLNFNPSELPKINSDPNRVRQLVTNLVSNSVKYTLKGQVDVSALLKDKLIEVSVKDTGIGIPGEEVVNLFTKFHRVKDKQTTEVRGTGLGLWITKQIVELLGGKITVESIYGTGTKFSFTLPVS